MPTHTRRQIIIALGAGALGVPLAAFAQQAQKSYRIGFLASEAPSDPSQAKRLELLKSGLRDLGYVEGKNIDIEVRWAEGHYDRLPALASELVALKVSVIVTSGTKATVAAKNATGTIPIVIGSTGDPIGLGLTTSLARPSANVTGSTNLGPELGAKLLELLKEAVPRITQVAYLVNPADRPTYLPAMQTTAKSFRLTLPVFEAGAPKQFDSAFAEMVKARCDAVLVSGDTLFAVNVQTVAELALKHGLPSASVLDDFAEVGGLITFGPDRLEGYRRAAVFVDKMLKGAKPGDLPIQQPSKFELIINTTTAKTLGVTIPQALQLRARLI
jgi:putative ABC transport system substrate-binding protein